MQGGSFDELFAAFIFIYKNICNIKIYILPYIYGNTVQILKLCLFIYICKKFKCF